VPETTHRTVTVDGLDLHIAEAGPPDGPTVLLLHGFPECWYSWRHQLTGLADQGFHVVAPDQRGYARSGRPEAIEAYTLLHLVGDALGVLDAVGAERAVVVGHDWGAPVAWHTALLRPDRVQGVVGLSVPLLPRSATPPLAGMAKRFGADYYQLYFQEPGVADAELAADPRATFRRLLSATGGSGPTTTLTVPPGGGFLDACPEPEQLPDWLTEDDLDAYVAEYAEHGFTGGLNWYRNQDRTWALTAAWRDAHIRVPAAYAAGDRDVVIAGVAFDALVTTLRRRVPDLRAAEPLPGCGHWTQQERPGEITALIADFARLTDRAEYGVSGRSDAR
jgi:pimeloyl-ACP methyl ester carboxylesterase